MFADEAVEVRFKGLSRAVYAGRGVEEADHAGRLSPEKIASLRRVVRVMLGIIGLACLADKAHVPVWPGQTESAEEDLEVAPRARALANASSTGWTFKTVL